MTIKDNIKTLNQVQNLPTLSTLLIKILHEIDRKSATAHSIKKTVEQDASLSAKLLKVANSPFYGLRQEITSIEHAIVILGIDEIVKLVLSLSMNKALKFTFDVKDFNYNNLWKHSFFTAHIASFLVEKYFPFIDANVVFTGGLLHDMGRFILPVCFTDKMQKIMTEWENNLYHLEKIQQIPHTIIGYYLGQKWRFSDVLLYCIRYHHNPKHNPDKESKLHVNIIFLADQLAQAIVNWRMDYSGPNLLLPPGLPISKKIIKDAITHVREIKDEMLLRESTLASASHT